MIAVLLWTIGVYSENQNLVQEVIRLQVVSNLDGSRDKQLIQKVRQAVCKSIREDLAAISDTAAARDYLSQNLTKIKAVVNNILSVKEYPEWARAEISKAMLDKQHYKTYSLPTGIYNSLCIVLGSDHAASG